MIERITDYPGYLIRLPASAKPKNGKAKADQAIVFFHGFPACSQVKNIDIALKVRDTFKKDVYLLHYKGLGESPGEFLWSRAVQESKELCQRLSEKYKKLSIVGHSFGGLVSVNMAEALPELLNCVVLMSPFCHLTKEEPLFEWLVEGVRAELPGIFGTQKRPTLEDDLLHVMINHLPTKIAPTISTKIPFGVIQASKDEVTPAPTTREFVANLKKKPKYMELPQDHGFLVSRTEITKAVVKMLRELM